MGSKCFQLVHGTKEAIQHQRNPCEDNSPEIFRNFDQSTEVIAKKRTIRHLYRISHTLSQHLALAAAWQKKGKHKLTPAEKREKNKRRAEYKTVFLNGKQKRIKREPTIDGMSVDEFIRRNADPIWLHQNEMWEYLHEHEGRENMNINPDLIAPCGLYCGVCAVYIAHRNQNQKFKERLLCVYKGEIPGKGKLPNSENLTIDDIRCNGCLSDDIFMHCRQCAIRDCTQERGYAGCHQCDEFPCPHIDDFPMTIGKKVILRAIPYWREVGTEKWIEDEEARYICPQCGNTLFRSVVTCNRCKAEVDLD